MPYRLIHYLIPVLALGLAIISQYSGLDLWLAHWFYDPQHHAWPYKDLWLTETVLHRGGRYLIAVLMLGVLVVFALSWLVAGCRRFRTITGYILASGLTSVALIDQLKSHIHIYTPWALQVFGGKLPHIRLFDSVPANAPIGHAFPAGHASGGYILLSLYFLFYAGTHRYRYAMLALAVAVGMIFGITQQARGAHMLSHDLTTIAICWTSCLLWGRLMLQGEQRLGLAMLSKAPARQDS